MIVGDTADRVSKRRLDPFPKVLVWAVLRESFGLLLDDVGEDGCICCEHKGVITREVVILGVRS